MRRLLLGEPIERCGQLGHGVAYVFDGGDVPACRDTARRPCAHDIGCRIVGHRSHHSTSAVWLPVLIHLAIWSAARTTWSAISV